MSDQEVHKLRSEVREVAEGLLQRAREDEAFAEQLRTDPRSTLIAAGLPEATVDDFIHQAGLDSEVSGYMNCQCSGLTCLDSDFDCTQSLL